MMIRDYVVQDLLTELWESLHVTAAKSCADAVQDMTITVQQFANTHGLPLVDPDTFPEAIS